MPVTCRICSSVTDTVLDLGTSPPANSLLESALESCPTYPLVLEHCAHCSNLQLRDCLDASDLYRNYLYVTPDSPQLRAHYERLSDWLTTEGYIAPGSFVLEIGSNIGLFLSFIKPRVRKVQGIDPAKKICQMAVESGIDTICDYFNRQSADFIRLNNGAPDLIVARHCLAHNRDPHVLVEAAASLLAEDGTLVIENAYVLSTVEQNEFDQIYHEHMFYFGVRSMSALLDRHDMVLLNVLLSPVHGGSIVFVAKHRQAAIEPDPTVSEHMERERKLLTSSEFARFRTDTSSIRSSLRTLVSDLISQGRSIYTYGATAKGNTLLNYVGLTHREIAFCVDSTPGKQGRYLPQSLIPVISEEDAAANPPDYYLLTAWNYREEIIAKVRKTGNQSTRFIVPVPSVVVV